MQVWMLVHIAASNVTEASVLDGKTSSVEEWGAEILTRAS